MPVANVPHFGLATLTTAFALCAAGCAVAPLDSSQTAKLARIQTLVVIYAENHSFDNLYGLFPGANGISRATPGQMTQLDHDGRPLRELIVFGGDGKPAAGFPRMPNRPFRIDAPPVNRPPTVVVPSPIHDYFYHQEQINGGRNNMFAAMSQVGGWTMGHYDGSVFKLWQWAREFTLADNFFQAAFGGSYLNHQWLICAWTRRASLRNALARHRPTLAPHRFSVPVSAAKPPRTATRSILRNRRISRAVCRQRRADHSPMPPTAAASSVRSTLACRCRRKPR